MPAHLFLRIAFITLIGLTWTSCSNKRPVPVTQKLGDPYVIAATVGMVSDIVKQVVGDNATVNCIIGTGVDPHLYRPTRNDVITLINADIVFYSGLMLEGRMGDALIKVSRSKQVYAVTELVDEARLLEPEGLQGHYDPHLWMDVSIWIDAVQSVAKPLAEYDLSNATEYFKNAKLYNEKLKKLHRYAKRCIESIPQHGRILITAHDAFNYFGRAYDIEVRGIQGLSTESEAGLDDIRQLVKLIVSRGVSAVFVESSVSEKNIRALIEGASARGHQLRIGGELFSDAMGLSGTYEGTYIGMIDHNVTVITRALGGQAPPAGMNGKLRSKNG